tara:strand:+ start:59 stop:271 length:213 start_codon:yes stop_codon:yes gene_type:complete
VVAAAVPFKTLPHLTIYSVRNPEKYKAFKKPDAAAQQWYLFERARAECEVVFWLKVSDCCRILCLPLIDQ